MNAKKLAKQLEAVIPEITEEQTKALLEVFSEDAKQQAEEHKEQTANLKKQLEEANAQIGKFKEMDIDKIKESANAWQEKYKNSEKEWQKRLDEMRYVAAAKEATSELKFTSNSAKRAFLMDLKEKQLPLDNDRLTGFDDFLNSYKETDPGAFLTAEPESEKPGIKYYPGVKGTPNLKSVPELDEAQMGFAKLGVDFNSVKEFSAAFNK